MRLPPPALLLASWVALVEPDQEPPDLQGRARRAIEGGAFEEAERLGAQALEIDRSAGDRRGILVDLQILADAAFYMARHATALDRYREAEALALSLGDRGTMAPLLANQGALLAVLGRYDEARETLGRALAESEHAGDRPRVAYVLLNQGMLESASGRYGEALRLLQRAGDEWRALGDRASEGRALLTLGGVYSEIGLAAEAEEVLERALSCFDEDRSLADRGRTLRTLGLALLDAGRFREALEVLGPAIEVLRGAKDTWGIASALRFRGMALVRVGRGEEAEAAFREAIDLVDEIQGDPFEALLAETGLAEALEVRRKGDEAERRYRRVITAASPLGTPEASWRARLGLGRTLEASGDEEGAIESYLAAIEEVEAIRTALGSQGLRGLYLGDKLELYRRAARLLARVGREEESFRFTEAAKARTLLEVAAVRPPDVREALSLPEREALRFRSAEQRLVEFELSASDSAKSVKQEDGREREVLHARIREVRAAHAQARLQAELADPRSARLEGIGQAPALEEVRRALGEKTALLEFLVGPEGSTIWVVRKEGAWFRELDVAAEEIDKWVSRVLGPIEDLRAGRTDAANLRFDAAAAAALHDRLLGPVADRLEGCDLLLVVPDGALRRLPFSLLVTRFEKRPVDPLRLYAQYAGLGFLVEEVAIGVLPTAGLLGAPRRAGGEIRALVFADPSPPPAGAPPLRAARAEAESVREALGTESVTILAGDEATEARLRSEALGSTILHFATHATLDDARPAYSSVVLAPGGGEDGRLHAYEVERLDAPGARIVLSGCETVGSAGRGEGMLGLARAFLLAGAEGVVATAWVVDDASTARGMGAFYDALSAGEAAAFALRDAQMALLEEGRRSGGPLLHPFSWAGFLSVGAW